MANKRLVASQTGSKTADINTEFQVTNGVPVTLNATLLAGSEEVDITYSGDGGTTFNTAFNDAGTALVLTATKPQIVVKGEGLYQVAKDTTVGACAVDVAPYNPKKR